jgi:hypothetical protein
MPSGQVPKSESVGWIAAGGAREQAKARRVKTNNIEELWSVERLAGAALLGDSSDAWTGWSGVVDGCRGARSFNLAVFCWAGKILTS